MQPKEFAVVIKKEIQVKFDPLSELFMLLFAFAEQRQVASPVSMKLVSQESRSR